jgi:hypothetical protein
MKSNGLIVTLGLVALALPAAGQRNVTPEDVRRAVQFERHKEQAAEREERIERRRGRASGRNADRTANPDAERAAPPTDSGARGKRVGDPGEPEKVNK